MNNAEFSELIKQKRKALGLTQMQLASKSGVSLPTIQNIESGKGNPSLKLIDSLFEVFGISLEVKSKTADWDLLAACGAPFEPCRKLDINPNGELMVGTLLQACQELLNNKNIDDRERKSDCVSALLLAIYIHFPKFFREKLNINIFLKFLPEKPSGKIIKLHRIALAKVATYL